MRIALPNEADIGFQMAPMIDIVFLLIIFFMVAARENQVQFQPIDVPVAEHSIIAKNPTGRGTVTITDAEELFIGAMPATLEDVEEMARVRFEENPRFRLLIRADQRVPHRVVRDVMKAAAAGGVSDIIFSAYQTPE